jgi:hypothetical protein
LKQNKELTRNFHIQQQWEDDLANSAFQNVKTCQVNFDYCHSSDRYQINGGQNIFLLGYSTVYPNLTDVINLGFQAWVNQSQSVAQWSDLNNFNGYAQGYETFSLKNSGG